MNATTETFGTTIGKRTGRGLARHLTPSCGEAVRPTQGSDMPPGERAARCHARRTTRRVACLPWRNAHSAANPVRQLLGNDSRGALPASPASLNRRQAIRRATSLALIAERLSKSAHSRQCPTPDSGFVPIKGLQQSPLRSFRPTAAAETGNCRPPEGRAAMPRVSPRPAR